MVGDGAPGGRKEGRALSWAEEAGGRHAYQGGRSPGPVYRSGYMDAIFAAAEAAAAVDAIATHPSSPRHHRHRRRHHHNRYSHHCHLIIIIQKH